MITSTIGRQWRLSQSQPDAVTVTAAAVDVTLSAAVREGPPTIGGQMSAAIAERKVPDVMFTLDGASKAEAAGGNWGDLSWVERYRRLQELGHIPRDVDPVDLETAAIAEKKVREVTSRRDVVLTLDGGNWADLSWVERYRRLQELGHIPRDVDLETAAIADDKVRDVMLTLDGASKAEATGGDTTEAESSAKRQAAIRAMLG